MLKEPNPNPSPLNLKYKATLKKIIVSDLEILHVYITQIISSIAIYKTGSHKLQAYKIIVTVNFDQ